MTSVAQRVEHIEARAWAELQLALPAPLKAQLGVRVERRGNAVCFATPGADVAQLNRVVGLGFDRALDGAELASIREWFGDAGVQRWVIEWSPEASPADGHRLLTQHGGVAKTPTVKLYGELAGLPLDDRSDGLTIAEVDAGAADQFQSTVASPLGVPDLVAPGVRSTVGHPGWHYYLALDAGRPIAGAALFTLGDGAWLGVAGTIPEARRRGAQTALLRRRLHDAGRLGCRWVSAGTFAETATQPNPSLHNMVRVGLRVLYHRPRYLFDRPPTAGPRASNQLTGL
jgi:GNAT superfamily N-acetyltransferase